MSHMDYGFYFFEEKKKLYVSLSLCILFFFFNYCLLVGFQQPSEKVNKDLSQIPHPPRSPASAQKYLTPARGQLAPAPPGQNHHHSLPACCLPLHTHSQVAPSLVLSPLVLCVS